MAKDFVVSQEEWIKAETYFNAHPNASKLERTVDVKTGKPRINKKNNKPYEGPAGLEHSFIQVKDSEKKPKIYAVSNRKKGYIGQGGMGKVKLAQNKDGEVFAFKIEGKAASESRLKELEIMRSLGRLEAKIGRA